MLMFSFMTFETWAENLCPNPSLEEGYLKPLGWESSSKEGFAWSDKYAHSGKHSLEITGNGKEITYQSYLDDSNNKDEVPDAEEAERIALKFLKKHKLLPQKAYVKSVVSDADGVEIELGRNINGIETS